MNLPRLAALLFLSPRLALSVRVHLDDADLFVEGSKKGSQLRRMLEITSPHLVDLS